MQSSDVNRVTILPLTQTATKWLFKLINDRCRYVYEDKETQSMRVCGVSERYHVKYRKCLHFEHQNQEIFIKIVMNGLPYYAKMHYPQTKFCLDCAIKLFVASNKLKYFTKKLEKIMKNSNFNVKTIKLDNKFVTFGIALLLLLQKPLVLKCIINNSKTNPSILYDILQTIYKYYSKWAKILKQDHTNRHKYVPDNTLSAIDRMTELTLRSFIYLLNTKLLNFIIFSDNGIFFKLYISDIWERTRKENNRNASLTHCALVWVPHMWWKKLYRNKKSILHALKVIYGVECNSKCDRVVIKNKRLAKYPYLQHLFPFLTKNPKKLLGDLECAINHYKSAYLKMHGYDTVCGNMNCQIGYFEHKYNDMYFDGTDTIMNFFSEDVVQRNKDRNNKPMFVWKLPRRGKWYLCSRCKMVYYCSKKCQKIDWNLYNHKYLCNLAVQN